MSEPKFTISILTYVALRQAKACIASVLKSKGDFKLILTANGNPDAAKYFTDLAKEFANITVIVNEKNEGYIEPQKKAFSMCDTEFFVMTNDDAIVPPDWLEKLAEPFARFPKAALSAPKGGCQTLLPNFHGVKGAAFEYLNGACICCKTEIMRKHGLFDPNLNWAYGDDSDLSLRMREAGYTLHYADFILQHEIGATSRHVKEVKPHQEANHTYLRKRWGHYLRVRRFDYSLVVQRTAAYGDVLLMTPVIRALKLRYPCAKICVETGCPEILARNPHVDRVSRTFARERDAVFINLNGSYEANPSEHFVRTYAKVAGVELTDTKTEFYPSEEDHSTAQKRLPESGWIGIHAGPCTWPGKMWPVEKWQELIKSLRERGEKIVLFGPDTRMPLESDADFRTRTTIHQMGAMMKLCDMVITLDSLPLHLAQAMGTPVVALFGVTLPGPILTEGSKAIAVCADQSHPEAGLRHRQKGTNFTPTKANPMDTISVAQVLEAVSSMPRKAETCLLNSEENLEP
jgi:ADP-heptose:LPS heptosyltransferase/GT2 family glycosyltransferase